MAEHAPTRVRLNAAALRLMMQGAGIGSVAELAGQIGVDRSSLSRSMRGEVEPSTRTITGIMRRFPLASYPALFPDGDAPTYGLTEAVIHDDTGGSA